MTPAPVVTRPVIDLLYMDRAAWEYEEVQLYTSFQIRPPLEFFGIYFDWTPQQFRDAIRAVSNEFSEQLEKNGVNDLLEYKEESNDPNILQAREAAEMLLMPKDGCEGERLFTDNANAKLQWFQDLTMSCTRAGVRPSCIFQRFMWLIEVAHLDEDLCGEFEAETLGRWRLDPSMYEFSLTPETSERKSRDPAAAQDRGKKVSACQA